MGWEYSLSYIHDQPSVTHKPGMLEQRYNPSTQESDKRIQGSQSYSGTEPLKVKLYLKQNKNNSITLKTVNLLLKQQH